MGKCVTTEANSMDRGWDLGLLTINSASWVRLGLNEGFAVQSYFVVNTASGLCGIDDDVGLNGGVRELGLSNVEAVRSGCHRLTMR